MIILRSLYGYKTAAAAPANRSMLRQEKNGSVPVVIFKNDPKFLHIPPLRGGGSRHFPLESRQSYDYFDQ